jgi:metacaspase-1
MATALKIMGIHGVGDHRGSDWETHWEEAVKGAFPGQSNQQLDFCFVNYDTLFNDVDLSGWKVTKALAMLAWSGISSSFGRRRGLVENLSDKVRWTAGYVVAWVADTDFKDRTRACLLEEIRREKPDVILAHSLGSLISYNLLTHEDAQDAEVARILKKVVYVTLGSQLGNAFVVKNLTPGRLTGLPVKQWFHLYNHEDDVFTTQVKLFNVPNFRQVDTPFDIEGFADHDATFYLKHPNTTSVVWASLAGESFDRVSRMRSFGMMPIAGKKPSKKKADQRQPQKRALLVGINNYPSAADKLEGCVNDVFLMSSVLQECGFKAEDIRVCLDARATAKGILDRLEWLLQDPGSGDQLLFYYSGHGARVPEYGAKQEPDHYLETLVPYDFDWTPETGVTDDHIHALYSQLPEDVLFSMIFDCCHSGGIHRDGGNRIRALNPPDDIRHRSLRWDTKTKMWVPRDFERLNDKFSAEDDVNRHFFGADGCTVRLGRAACLRGQSEEEYESMKAKAKNQNFGPYLPLIIEACQEEEYSYEYRHGVISHGAFTYSLCDILRRRGKLSFEQLITETRSQLKDLRYDQCPQILGPSAMIKAPVPWLGDR